MKALLWILGCILLLDVLLVAIFAASAAVVRRRAPRPALDAAGWPFGSGSGRPQLLAAVPAASDENDEPGPSRRDLVRLVRDDELPAAPPNVRRAGTRRRLAGVALAAALAVAGTAVASPEVRHFVATAIGVVSEGLTSTSVEPDQAADIGGADTATAGDASRAPNAASETSAGERPGAGPAPGPTGDPRPPGVPHQGVLAPPTPANVTAMPAGSGEIAVAWADVEGETSYRVERALDPGGPWNMSATPAQDVTAVTDSGLSAGTTYYYRIIAIDPESQSDPSDVASATTTVDVPASPTGMTAFVAGADRIDLHWDDVADESGYRIERSADGGSGWLTIGTTGRDVTTATDANLEAGTTYWYRVVAANDAGESPPSDAAWATTDQPTTGDQGGGPDPGSAARVSMGGAAGTDVQSDTSDTRRRIAR